MKERVFVALRWIFLFPLSAIAGWAVFAFITISWQQIVPSFGVMSSLRYPIRALIEFVASGFMGAAFAWASFFIAPSQKKVASYVSSAIAGALVLISSGIGLAQGNTRALLMTLPVLVGLTWVCRSISKDEISIKSDVD